MLHGHELCGIAYRCRKWQHSCSITSRTSGPAEGESSVLNSPSATIEHVDISGKGEQTQVRVDGTGYLTYKAFWLNQPDRLVLDFSGAVVREQERSISSSFQPVHLVRIGQFKTNVARVVIEIEKQSTYTITASSHSVMVAFGPYRWF